MAKSNDPYVYLIVESYKPSNTSGLHGEVHIRPIAGQGCSTELRVEGSKKMSENHPVGTKFRIKAKLTDRKGGGEFLYTSYKWKYEVID